MGLIFRNSFKKGPSKKKRHRWILILFIVILSVFMFLPADKENTITPISTQFTSTVMVTKSPRPTSTSTPIITNSPSPTQEPTQKIIVYTTSSGKKYHRISCQYVQNKELKDWEIEKAISLGFTSCSKCNP